MGEARVAQCLLTIPMLPLYEPDVVNMSVCCARQPVNDFFILNMSNFYSDLTTYWAVPTLSIPILHTGA